MIKGIAHLAFQVKDMKETLAFYEKAFGFKPKFSLKDDQGNPWIEYMQVSPVQFIEFFYASQSLEQKPGKTSYQHLCLEVEDIRVMEKHLESVGIPLLHPVILGKDHNFQCWVKDPDGNPIELMQYGINAMQLAP